MDSDFLTAEFDKFLFRSMVTSGDSWSGYSSFPEVRKQVPGWSQQFGYIISWYSNDHNIEGKPHLHIDHPEKGIGVKVDLQGNVLQSYGSKPIPGKMQKRIKEFLATLKVQKWIKEQLKKISSHY